MFRSKKKTIVGTSTSRVIDDKNLPNSAKSAIIDSIINKTDISGNLVDNIINGLSIKGTQFYNYGEKNLPYDLPTRHIYSDINLSQDIRIALTQIFGDIDIQYGFFGSPNYMHLAWETVIKDMRLNYETNIFEGMGTPQNPVYLFNITLHMSEAHAREINIDSLFQWGRSPKSGYYPIKDEAVHDVVSRYLRNDDLRIDNQATYPYAIVYMITKDIEDEYRVIITQRRIELPVLQDHKEYLHVQYTLNNKDYFWHYEMDSGVYPHLENILNRYESNEVAGLFFPFTYFRYDKIKPEKGTEEYRISTNLVKKINMKYGEVVDAVHDNPDIKDVEQAMLVWAVNGLSESPVEIKYLFHFFDTLKGSSETSGMRTDRFQTNKIYQMLKKGGHFLFPTPQIARPEYSAIEIRDQKFRMALNHEGIEERFVGGTIGSVGTYQSAIEEYIDYMSFEEEDRVIKLPYRKKRIIYRRQESQSMYRELRVYDLETKFYVYGSHHTTSDDDENKDILLVPLDFSLMGSFSSLEKEKLYGQSLQFVFNSRVVQKVKWDQRGFFKSVISIAAIALVIYSAGTSLAALASGIAAGTVTLSAVFLSLMKSFLLNMVITFGVQILSKQIGIEIMIVLTAVIAAYGFYDFVKSGGFKNAVWAEDLLKMSNSMSSGIKSHVSSEFQKMVGDYQKHLLEMEDAWEELREINDTLTGSTVLTPFTFLGERPDSYYNRTLNMGDISELSISSVRHYYDISLKLPENLELIGE